MAVPRGVLVWIGCTMLASTPCVAEIFQADVSQDVSDAAMASERSDERTSFDIPAQALMTALRAYSERTGVSVLFDDSLVRNRRSPGVSGSYGPPEALQRLLDGTGLAAHYASPRAFTLMPEAAPAAANESDSSEDTVASDRFAGRLQASLVRSLCSSEKTHPGRYRLAMQLWLDAAGAVTRTQLLSSTGNAARDSQIESLAAGIVVGEMPVGMPQPVTILLLPRPAEQPFDCSPYRRVG
jgi:hypothetical protein